MTLIPTGQKHTMKLHDLRAPVLNSTLTQGRSADMGCFSASVRLFVHLVGKWFRGQSQVPE